MTKIRIWMLLAVCLAFGNNVSFAKESTQDPEILKLVEVVEKSGCTFHRNGSEYASARAADHLRLKLRRGKKYADTPEHFIERLASKSSWSGKPYHIECVEGEKIEMQVYLTRELQNIRQDAESETVD